MPLSVEERNSNKSVFVVEKGRRTPNMASFKKQLVNVLSKVILAIAVCLIGVLAIPVCIFLLPIIFIWTIVDKLLCVLERVD